MSYFQDLYIKPVKNTCIKWKEFLLTFGIEICVVLMIYFLFGWGISNIASAIEPLADNNLENQTVLASNAFLYASEMESFFNNYYFTITILSVLIFLLYTVSRTIIWSKLLKIKLSVKKYFENLITDVILAVLIVLAYFFVITFIREEIHTIGLIVLWLPLLYYSFLVHLNLKKDFLERFKIKSSEYLIILPHTILVSVLALLLFNLNWGLIPGIALLAFYRIIVIEIKNLQVI